MTDEEAVAFAGQWVTDWNSHDVEAVLRHFADDVVFTSPLASRLFTGSGGVVRGKQRLREYWVAGLAAHPDLRFELLGVFGGVDTVVISYRNEAGLDRCEVLTFSGGLVAAGHATYPVTSG
jgi:ketosteroid isomerase-like protein